MDFPVVPIHKHPKYKLECCKLINDEWKRSETARMRSLDCSSDKLPTSLILLDENDRVIGHCKLSPIPSIPGSCYIESVVILKDLRGKGYGTYLMKRAEEYCKNVLKLKVIYLSTKGQEPFYTKLGYLICQPVSIYGSFISNNTINVKNENSINVNNNCNINTVNGKTYMCKYIA
ncbi:N-alpha-acetyltransferase 80 isoform X2 [Onthophagus taurus]